MQHVKGYFERRNQILCYFQSPNFLVPLISLLVLPLFPLYFRTIILCSQLCEDDTIEFCNILASYLSKYSSVETVFIYLYQLLSLNSCTPDFRKSQNKANLKNNMLVKLGHNSFPAVILKMNVFIKASWSRVQRRRSFSNSQIFSLSVQKTMLVVSKASC